MNLHMLSAFSVKAKKPNVVNVLKLYSLYLPRGSGQFTTIHARRRVGFRVYIEAKILWLSWDTSILVLIH